MKKLIFILFAGLAMQGCKKQCEESLLEVYNNSNNLLYVLEYNNNTYTPKAVITPNSKGLISFNKGNSYYKLSFISGVVNKIDSVYLTACETTYYHASVR